MCVPTAPAVCVCVCVHCSRCVCALGWVKYREHISLLVILCIIVYVYFFFFTKPISDYGKMLKYRSISTIITTIKKDKKIILRQKMLHSNVSRSSLPISANYKFEITD